MKEELYELALYAGGGGGLLASKLEGNRIVCYVEWDKYCVEVIKARIRDGYLDDAPIWDDCNTFDGKPWAGLVDVVSAGFPCQPFSCAGRGMSGQDPRNGWPATLRIISEVRPGFAWLENVPGLISKPYIRRIFGDLAEIGYDAEWGCLSAAAVGANHKRERLWIVAYPKGLQEYLQLRERREGLQPSRIGSVQPVADTNGGGHKDVFAFSKYRQPIIGRSSEELPNPEFNHVEEQGNERSEVRTKQGDWWSVEPLLGRVANGVAHRVDRLATIGNGQVPEVARTAWHFLRDRIGVDPR